MDTIKNIDELIRRLNMCTGDYCYLEMMRQMDIPETEWERYYRWNDEKYTRTQLTRNDDYELVLICWEKGQESHIHDYDANEAWIHPVKGTLREERFVLDSNNKLEKVSSVLLGPGDFSYMNENMDIHRYSNVYESRSASLHLYAKPVDQWNIYTEEGSSETKEVWWDQVEEQQTVTS